MSDKKLDLLYGLCFNQLLRSKLSPTYVEKRILNETVNSVRAYLLQFVEELKKKVGDYEDYATKSYLTWDAEYYEKDAKEKVELLEEFKKKIEITLAEEFLNVDFSKTGTKLDKEYPKSMPKSKIRETLWDQWKLFKEKHE